MSAETATKKGACPWAETRDDNLTAGKAGDVYGRALTRDVRTREPEKEEEKGCDRYWCEGGRGDGSEGWRSEARGLPPPASVSGVAKFVAKKGAWRKTIVSGDVTEAAASRPHEGISPICPVGLRAIVGEERVCVPERNLLNPTEID